jgi:hypothetical protein
MDFMIISKYFMIIITTDRFDHATGGDTWDESAVTTQEVHDEIQGARV